MCLKIHKVIQIEDSSSSEIREQIHFLEVCQVFKTIVIKLFMDFRYQFHVWIIIHFKEHRWQNSSGNGYTLICTHLWPIISLASRIQDQIFFNPMKPHRFHSYATRIDNNPINHPYGLEHTSDFCLSNKDQKAWNMALIIQSPTWAHIMLQVKENGDLEQGHGFDRTIFNCFTS